VSSTPSTAIWSGIVSPRTLPVSVVVPTIGRPEQLEACLASIAVCDPHADEIVVADQSGTAEVAAVVGRFAGARVVACTGRGVSASRNTGLAAARNEIVLVTDDDCTVDPDWVGIAWQLMGDDPDKIVTGRVLPVGDARAVPSTIDDPLPKDYTGERRGGLLFPNNMAVSRSRVLAEGGFDERFSPEEAAEDNDFCYRWLKAGHRLVYEPALTVHHHDWRTREELRRLYRRYAQGEGFLYAKHLRQGDLRMLRFIARNLVWWARSLAAAVVKRREGWTDARRAIPLGLAVGLWRGWRAYGRHARR
jgi:GT2 family glycosyltransferase